MGFDERSMTMWKVEVQPLGNEQAKALNDGG